MTPQDKISALDRVVNSESFNIANHINESHYTLFEKAIAELENEPKVLLNEVLDALKKGETLNIQTKLKGLLHYIKQHPEVVTGPLAILIDLFT